MERDGRALCKADLKYASDLDIDNMPNTETGNSMENEDNETER